MFHCRMMPGGKQETDTDLVDFGNLDNLHAAFAPALADVVWCEDLPTDSPSNDQGVPCIRTVFRIRKDR